MRSCLKTIWQVPLFCLIAAWVDFHFLAVPLIRMAMVTLPDGTITVDRTGTMIAYAVIFTINAIAAWFCFRKRTRRELFWSAALLTAYGLLLLAAQWIFQITTGPAALWFYHLHRPFDAFTFPDQLLAGLCFRLSDSIWLPSIPGCFLPFLFVLLGRRENGPLHLENQDVAQDVRPDGIP